MTRNVLQLPSNSGTPNATTVYTATGFNAGDPVYFQNGDYKSPANLTPPSSVSFNIVEQAAIYPTGTGGIVAPAFSYAQMQAGFGGGTSRQFAAVLTNGNIVQAWSSHVSTPTNPNCVYFRVVDSSGTVVVSPTVVSTTYTQTADSNVSVVALTGGGFAIGWINSAGGTANSANYAIYSNTGSVVTAATQDTSFAAGASSAPIQMTKLANGGFAIAVKYSSGAIYLRSYGATGTGAYTTQNTTLVGYTVIASFAIASRSDSSVFICDMLTTGSYKYVIYSSAGSASVGPATFSTASTVGNAVGGCSASVQTDGTTIVIAFYSNTSGTGYNYPAVRLLPASNTLGSEIACVPEANLFYQYSYSGGYISVLSLSSNNFIVFFSDGYGNMQYAFYNSSGTCISGSNTTGTIPRLVTGGHCAWSNGVTLIESSGSVYAYWSASKPDQKPVQQVYCKLNTTTYAITPFLSTTGTTTTVSGAATGALIPSTVSPSAMSYYSTASTTVISTNTPSTVVAPTVVNSAATDSVASCTLPNGQFVVVYRLNASPWTVYANVYTASGSLVTTVTVGTGIATANTYYCLKVAALSGGGFVVAWLGSSNTTINLSVFSSAFVQSASTTFSISSAFSSAIIFDVAGLQDNKFVVAYNYTGSQGYADAYSSSCTLLQNFNLGPQMSYSMCVAGNPWGGFSVAGFYSGSPQGYRRTFVPTGTNTWAQYSTGSMTSNSAYTQNPQLCGTQSGQYIMTSNDSSYPQYVMFNDSGNADVPYTASMSSWPLGSGNGPTSYPMLGLGLTGNGQVVLATSYGSTSLGIACVPAQMTWSTGQPLAYSITGSSNRNMFSKNGYSILSSVVGNNAQPRVTSGLGNNVVITFLTASNYPAFAIVNATNNSLVTTISANSTASALVPVSPMGNTTTNIAGVLAGVAATTASAGSTGQLITNGQVQLGSSYTSTATGAFDYTGQAVSGVKGTFNGKNINLQGNS